MRWEVKPLGEVCDSHDNIKWSNESSQYQYVDLSSVSREHREITESVQIDASNAPSRAKRRVFEGDVLFGTTRPMLRRYALVPAGYDNAIASTGFCVLRPKESLVTPRFIFYSLIFIRLL